MQFARIESVRVIEGGAGKDITLSYSRYSRHHLKSPSRRYPDGCSTEQRAGPSIQDAIRMALPFIPVVINMFR
ncbi:MAG: hypothetical protein PVG70_21660 [Desulfobacterales bacterium]